MTRARDAGFTLIEVLIATFIAGILSVMIAQMIQSWSKAVTRQGARAARMQNESDMRRLYTILTDRGAAGGSYPTAGPWPPSIPVRGAVPWTRPASGFDELGWAPGRSPTLLQYRIEGWATGFAVSALGDTDRDGGLELYRIGSDVGMFEGPLPWPPVAVEPVNPTGPPPGGPGLN